MTAPLPTPRAGLPARARLRTPRDFQRVYQRGLRTAGALVTVVALRRHGGGGARLGVSVSKEHGAAVRRNKLKRLLREAFRLERAAFPGDLDIVLIPRPRAGKLSLHELRAELTLLLQRLSAGKGQRRAPRGRQ